MQKIHVKIITLHIHDVEVETHNKESRSLFRA